MSTDKCIKCINNRFLLQVTFKCDRELELKNEAIFKCYIVEPSLPEGKETIACIPIQVNVKAVFSK